jgi:hypothetical protein
MTWAARAPAASCRSSPPPFAGDTPSAAIWSGRDKAYVPGVVDFLVIHLVPIDYWYIIPFAAVSRTAVSLQFTPQKQGHKYECYLEAWPWLRAVPETVSAHTNCD